MMKTSGAFLAIILALGLGISGQANAGQFRLGHKFQHFANEYGRQNSDNLQLTQDYGGGDDAGYDNGDFAISPSQAASIAKRSWPGSKVLRVQLLPSGVYAVTLKQGGEVSRVLVDASSGDLV